MENEGWIEWAGGECPVEAGVYVLVRYRDGLETTAGNVAGIHVWGHVNTNQRDRTQVRMPCAADIIAYRIAEPLS